jgi:hypothetical protein
VIGAWEVQAQLSPPYPRRAQRGAGGSRLLDGGGDDAGVDVDDAAAAGAWTRIANGTSMGNKWIKLLDTNLTVSALRTVVTATARCGDLILLRVPLDLPSRFLSE